MPSFNYVKRGDRIEIPSAEWHNALVDAIRFTSSMERGILDKQTSDTKRFMQQGDVVDTIMEEDVDEYGIFTIKNNVDFELQIPVATHKKIEDEDAKVFIVNHHTACYDANRYVLPILGVHKPYMVHYDPADGLPVLGEVVGPKPNTYKVSVDYKGCLCVSAPDTDMELVWIIRDPGTRTISGAIAQLAEELCPDDEIGSVNNFEYLDHLEAEAGTAVTTADNLFRLAGEIDDYVYLNYRKSTETWIIIQVQHHIRNIVVEVTDEQEDDGFGNFLQVTGCDYIQGNVLEKAAIMSCGNESWKNQIALQSHSTITGLTYSEDENGCTLTASKNGVCSIFGGATTPTTETIMTFSIRDVVTSVTLDEQTCTFSMTVESMCVLSLGAGEDVAIGTMAEIDVLTDIDYVKDGDGCRIEGTVVGICAFVTAAAETGTLIPMYSREAVKAINYANCTIQADIQTFCTFDPEGAANWEAQIGLVSRSITAEVSTTGGTGSGEGNQCQTLRSRQTTVCLFEADDAKDATDLLSFTEVAVVVGSHEDGDCIYLDYQVICVIASLDESADTKLICGVDCVVDTGSASGSP